MTPLQKIYWLRLALGIVAAILCIGYGIATNTISAVAFDWAIFVNGLSLALLVYFISYYAIKSHYAPQVAKTSKLFTTGIGVYIMSWIVLWTLLYTILASLVPTG